jgi:2,3-dihydro-2,3-dihydroxybenzoate dehydrogenase
MGYCQFWQLAVMGWHAIMVDYYFFVKEVFMKEEVTFILGGTRGIGAAIADRCAANGHKVIVAGSSVDPTGVFDERERLHCNLLEPGQIREAIKQLLCMVRVRHFFWVSGILRGGVFADQPIGDIYDMLAVNFQHAVSIGQLLWKQMQDMGQPASFVAIGSSAAYTPRIEQAVYAASKAAMRMLVHTMRLENKHKGKVILQLVHPGGTGDTQLFDKHPVPNQNKFMKAKFVGGLIYEQLEQNPQDREYYIERPDGRIKEIPLKGSYE